eukprot:TRINITY_DN17381_c0_g1_i1.p1 TRINITY_DN17381_c0_g1~~TRINITY_DN17381_c0_g1_i1.p1  ORF type:complete len:487 (+),score=136.37 TRINITY_DN17381_c0_g1_i1:22-1461(+)
MVSLRIVLSIALAVSGAVAIHPGKIITEDWLAAGTLRAGASKIDGTLPLGVPLAGFNHGKRRVPYWPIPEFKNYTTFMTGNEGAWNPTWCKALVIDNGAEQIAFATLDGIGSDENLNYEAYGIASTMGFNIPITNIIFSASHSHSGPGAVSADSLWSLAPATDLLVPEIRRKLATSIATSLVEAFHNLAPAKIDIGTGDLVGVTVNRRARISPYVQRDTIDPHLGVIRVDTAAGVPLATMWNFAIHGVCFGSDNLKFSSDIMGYASDVMEKQIGGIALFMNGDAGDIDPAPGMCKGMPSSFAGGPIIADAVQKIWKSLNPTNQVSIIANSVELDFGPTNLNATFQRFDNCTTGGPLDICGICSFIQCEFNPHLGSAWLENTPRFTGISFVINNVSSVIVSIPGEALVELGWWIRNDTLDLGYQQTLLAGYSNAHMGYFATPNEYDIGGYESQLTFWGIDTASKIRNGCKLAATSVLPTV